MHRLVLAMVGAAALVAFPQFVTAQSYRIGTVAGGNKPYFYIGTGDGGLPTSAALANPTYDVAVDPSGNLFIAAGLLVRKVTPAGVISTVAGGGSGLGEGIQATRAALSPTAVVLDSAGNLYIADTAYGTSRIRKVDPKGVITTVAGGAPCCSLGDGGPAIEAYLAIPYGLAVDTNGNLYIAQISGQNDNLIRRVSLNGLITTVAGGGPCCAAGDGGPATSTTLARPTGIAVDSGGNIFIAEFNGNRVRKVSRNGIITTVAGTGANTNAGDGGQAVNAAVASPWHVAVDAAGVLYLTEINGSRIRRVASDGTITTIAGNGTDGYSGDGGDAGAAAIDRPAGIAVGSRGQIFFAESSFAIARVRSLTPSSAGQPTITPGGVVPVFSSLTTIQPGSWVSIFGINLATDVSIWNGDFPTSLGGTSVTINSKPAFIWFVSPTQINVQAPDDTATGSVSVVVTTPGGTGTSAVTLARYAPSLSLLNSKYAAAIVPTPNSPGNTGAGYDVIGPTGAFSFPTRPVRAGETLVLYGVGFGPTDPFVTAGKLFSGAAPVLSLPQVTVGGKPATVGFAGMIQAGLFQLNIVVPQLNSGDQVVQATVGGVATGPAVFITIQ